MQEIILVGDQMAKQSAGAVKLLEKLHENFEKATPQDRASLYNRAKTAKKVFEDLCKAIEAWSLNTQGEIEGYEVGPGKGMRAWADGDFEIEINLCEEFGKHARELYDIKSPAEMEKFLGNDLKAKNAVARLTKVEEGKLGLRPKAKK